MFTKMHLHNHILCIQRCIFGLNFNIIGRLFNLICGMTLKRCVRRASPDARDICDISRWWAAHIMVERTTPKRNYNNPKQKSIKKLSIYFKEFECTFLKNLKLFILFISLVISLYYAIDSSSMIWYLKIIYLIRTLNKWII